MLVLLLTLPSLPKSFQEMLCVRRGSCHLIYFSSEESQGVVSDILPCSGRTAEHDVILVCLLCPVMKEARLPRIWGPKAEVELSSWTLHPGGAGS